MPRYAIVYIGGNQPASLEEARQNMVRYREWLDSLGEAAVSPANPFRSTRTVHADRSVTNGSVASMSGYSIVAAESMEGALVMAKSCRFLDTGGSLEVSELVPMTGGE